jgi:hypothetical protein
MHRFARALVMVALIAGCGGPSAKPPLQLHAGHHHAGERSGIHGMVLFGRTHHYVEHIPMFSPPHDEQLVLRVALRDANGAPIARDFSGAAHTIQPTAKFSLDDLAVGARTSFVGDVFAGNFEGDGTLLLAGVTVTVEQVLVARRLGGVAPAADHLPYLLIGEPGDAYLTHVVGEFQQILRVDSSTLTSTPAHPIAIHVPGPARLAGGAISIVLTPDHGTVKLELGEELWCMRGPDFTAPCS